MSRLLLSIIFILLSAGQISAYKRESIDINVNGKQRNMITFVPNSLPAKSPLFIVTHGMNCTPEQQIYAVLTRKEITASMKNSECISSASSDQCTQIQRWQR